MNVLARLSAVVIVSLLCIAFVLVLPRAIESREKQISKWSTDASGSAVPAASPASSPPPFPDLRFSSPNLNHGPGRGMKTASGSGRPGEVPYE